MFDIIMYIDENGGSPVDVFLDKRNNITRLFYFFERNKVIIVDHAIIKKTQKTPKSDIDLALARKRSFERRQLDEL